MTFEKELKQRTEAVEAVLRSFLPEEKGPQETVISAMNYSILSGGKRLRPLLLQECFQMCGGTGELSGPFMAALEMIHTYSLIHDDLPCMDNDEYRRGRKTTHVVYGEGMAVLAGDALLNFAFETAARAFDLAKDAEEAKRVARAFSILAAKAGIYGMIGGQVADLEAENMGDAVTEEQLLFIHEHKTAALIQSAMTIGAVLAGAPEADCGGLERCAYLIGVAFQIQDDILDVTGSAALLGKPTGSDEKNQKTTYVTLKGLKQAREEVRRLSDEAVSLLVPFGNEFLERLVLELMTREK